MRRRGALVVIAIVLIVGALGVVVREGLPVAARATSTSAASAPASSPPEAASVAEPASPPTTTPMTTTTPPTTTQREAERARERREVEVVRRAIEEARRARIDELARTSAPPRDEDDAVGRLDPEYVRSAVREVLPLLGECYELARDAAQREGEDDPEGRLVTRFVIGGEPGVGGVIEEAEVMEASTLRDAVLEECFVETLRTIELPAPEAGGRVEVHYPFALSPEDDD
ncbi:AgmX/PglI C-terminal domain-containing protein [Sandaracinus amylolyticus]|uniref:AgmX/PglI C-terminal domain-containing protein n=1 Tax=Sandaracinus amylolyticus TaxID=927083 RepID=UPI0012EEDF8F|nr:AgmX/PglI C-terminal domain-containing protein [Sandaracinus amylolyticus]